MTNQKNKFVFCSVFAVIFESVGRLVEAACSLFSKTKELEAQKSLALEQLETQVDELSQLIKEKLLGKEVVL